ncbi:hypothetical protein [Actinomyces bowdenii]|uniref:DUF2637 domain-containing protein n=1 Tax=Actinomyces bowdenii TaxID=131109 RepID=A0A3P1US44_9ACTO|nr:hypothetical protein [Actinomyces bowdenii]RRD24448.1 hypothetical protein EII10_11340 [Actinomyces bowdenii]
MSAAHTGGSTDSTQAWHVKHARTWPNARPTWRDPHGTGQPKDRPRHQRRHPDGTRTGVATLSSPTTALTAAVALGATAVSVEGLAELLRATAALSAPMSWGIGSVIDLAVIVLALQAREAVITGHGGHLEMALTWFASAASGVASTSWQLGQVGVQAAAVRLVLPLLAACLWHLSIVDTRAAADAHPARRQARASRLTLNLALTQADTSGRPSVRRRELRARRDLLRHMAATSPAAQDRDLGWWRQQVAEVANERGAGTPTCDTQAVTGAAMATDSNGSARRVRYPGTQAHPPAALTAQLVASDVAAPVVAAPQPSTRERVAAVLRDDPAATSTQIRDQLGEVSLGTVQRHIAAIARQDGAT